MGAAISRHERLMETLVLKGVSSTGLECANAPGVSLRHGGKRVTSLRPYFSLSFALVGRKGDGTAAKMPEPTLRREDFDAPGFITLAGIWERRKTIAFT